MGNAVGGALNAIGDVGTGLLKGAGGLLKGYLRGQAGQHRPGGLFDTLQKQGQPEQQGPSQGLLRERTGVHPQVTRQQDFRAPDSRQDPLGPAVPEGAFNSESVKNFHAKLTKFAPRGNPEILRGISDNSGLLKAGGITGKRLEAFIAQMSHESAGFRTLTEYSSGKQYEGRKDLGNTQRGDGARYKGRGIIQLTGRSNYKTIGKQIGVDLESSPHLASRPDVAMKVAIQFWNNKGLNKYADRGNFREITRRINGGFNGLRDRQNQHRRAQALQFGGK